MLLRRFLRLLCLSTTYQKGSCPRNHYDSTPASATNEPSGQGPAFPISVLELPCRPSQSPRCLLALTRLSCHHGRSFLSCSYTKEGVRPESGCVDTCSRISGPQLGTKPRTPNSKSRALSSPVFPTLPTYLSATQGKKYIS